MIATPLARRSASASAPVPVRPPARLATLALLATLAGCGGGGATDSAGVIPAPAAILDTDADGLADAARMIITVGATGGTSLTVSDNSTVYNVPRRAGFVVSDPSGLIDLSLLGDITVSTLLGGTIVESGSLAMDLVELGGDADVTQRLVWIDTNLPFDLVRIELASLLSAAEDLDVYAAGVGPGG